MNAFEFRAQLNENRTLTVPSDVADQVPPGETVRVVILWQRSDDEADWQRLTAEQFLEGYAESDAIYDELPSE
jgi:hypothetical protein